ncbi:MAG: hypothetical protein IPN72_13675 [Saprospiraceae bacterium]|nr:hypothetical protein [Saprospiraceae bacterium]
MSDIIDDAKKYVENEILVNKEDQPQEIISKYAVYSSGLGILPGNILSSASLGLVVYKMVDDLNTFYKRNAEDKSKIIVFSLVSGAVYITLKTVLDAFFEKVPQLRMLSSMVSGALLAHLVITITGKIANGILASNKQMEDLNLKMVVAHLREMASSGDLKKEVIAAFTDRKKLSFKQALNH